MEISTNQEAFSSTSASTYHVFLSFRGKDTRQTFTDHLYTSLVNAGFRTFRDDDEIERGEYIELELQKAIEQSRISIIVFSKNYSSSTWCLEELVRILHCKKTKGRKVLPVFYKVKPSQVREQTESFAEAFDKHEKQCSADKVKEWREALREVAGLGGLELRKLQKRSEAEFVEEIVKEIEKKLDRIMLNVALYPIGIDNRVQKINMWLQDNSFGVGIAAIYGIGGIGKTTIAKTVYNQNCNSFEGRSFLANIRETSKRPNGLIRLQKQLISDILNGKKEKINSIDAGIVKVKDAVSCKRVLVVLDDVDQLSQLKAILGMRNWLYQGSKILITTRHMWLLKSYEECLKFEVQALHDDESLELLSWHAFRQPHPTECYTEIAKNFVQHCGGIPLALEVLGASLSNESMDVWRSALKKLEMVFENQIFEVLKISYDSLPDEHDKNLFLHIACFFVGKDKHFVIKILDECDFCTTVGVQNLLNRCLLTIDKDNKLMMHQLLQDMGREIVRQESPNEPGKRSRLWHHEDTLKMLREKTGTESIQGLVLNFNVLQHNQPGKRSFAAEGEVQFADVLDKTTVTVKRRRLGFLTWFPAQSSSTGSLSTSSVVDLETDAFTRMSNVKILQLNFARMIGSFEQFPERLRWFSWQGFPMEYIPSNFHMADLIALDMRYSNLIRVWEGTKVLISLKILNLSHSHDLISTPDFSQVPNLERLILKSCINLVEIHESIQDLGKLVVLNLKDCKKLMKLPSRFFLLKSLEVLILSGCSKLTELPMELDIDMSKYQSPSTTRVLKNVFKISTQFPQSLFWSSLWPKRSSKSATTFALAFLPQTLKSLELADCNLTDSSIPILFDRLSSLEHLNLAGNPISYLPENLKSHTILKSLVLERCENLESLPELPLSLTKLNANSCSSLKRITNLPNLLTLLDLTLGGCKKLDASQNLFKLETIASFHAEVSNYFGLHDLEWCEDAEVELISVLTSPRTASAKGTVKGPIMGLYEFGIFSTFLPGDIVPHCFSRKSALSDTDFVIKKNTQKVDIIASPLVNGIITGISICIVCDHDFPDVYGDDIVLCIHNKTKNLTWRYSPILSAMPRPGEPVTWLSHWKFGNKLEPGDQIEIVLYSYSGRSMMRKCGIHLFYEKINEKIDFGSECETTVQHITSFPSFNSVILDDISEIPLCNKSFLLNHSSCPIHHDFYTITFQRWLIPIKSIYGAILGECEPLFWDRKNDFGTPVTYADTEKVSKNRGKEFRFLTELALQRKGFSFSHISPGKDDNSQRMIWSRCWGKDDNSQRMIWRRCWGKDDNSQRMKFHNGRRFSLFGR